MDNIVCAALPGPELPDFTYEALPSPREDSALYVRLFVLQPGSYDDPILGELFAVDHSEAPPYRALSYSWGSSTRNAAIVVPGAHPSLLRVTRNLEACLRRVRDSFDVELLWIDAICIDQANVEERGHQVQAMEQIYQGCQRVIVWLGEADRPCFTRDSTVQDDLMALLSIGQRMGVHAWWRRLWVVQEFLLPRSHPILLLGPYRLSVLQLYFRLEKRATLRALSDNNGHVHRDTNERDHLDQLAEIVALRMAHETNPEPRGLLQMLVATREHHCADRRDKTYALLSMVNPHERAKFSADYSKLASQLDAELFHYCFGMYDTRYFGSRPLEPPKSVFLNTWQSYLLKIDPLLRDRFAVDEDLAFDLEAILTHNQSDPKEPIKIFVVPAALSAGLRRVLATPVWIQGVLLGFIDRMPTLFDSSEDLREVLRIKANFTVAPYPKYNSCNGLDYSRNRWPCPKPAVPAMITAQQQFVAVLKESRSDLRSWFNRHLPGLATILTRGCPSFPSIEPVPHDRTPKSMETGDMIVAARNHKWPLVLRPAGSPGQYILVDFCIENESVDILSEIRAHIEADCLANYLLV